MSKESFKKFVKKNPSLINYVTSNKISWQSLYEIYELYGENDSIWNEYKISNKYNYSLNEIFNTIKNIDLKKLQSGIENIQSTINLIQNFGAPKQNNYEPNRKYQHIDD
ncbi:MAG: hypothetical protein IJN90_06100 [Bacilli bacterium]|nr:hypothetical protein [Bacilli bacterium]